MAATERLNVVVELHVDLVGKLLGRTDEALVNFSFPVNLGSNITSLVVVGLCEMQASDEKSITRKRVKKNAL